MPNNRARVVIVSRIISWPVYYGADKRLVSMVKSLVAVKREVHVVLLGNRQSTQKIQVLKSLSEAGASNVYFRSLGRFDHYLGSLFFPRVNHGRSFPAVYSPLLWHWFFRIVRNLNPQVIISAQVEWTPLVHTVNANHIAIDCVDIWTRHCAQLELIANRFPLKEWSFPAVDDPILDESCFDRIALPEISQEMTMLGKYQTILTISAVEAAEICQWVHGAAIHCVPMCLDPVDIENNRNGPPLLIGNNHPFNAQAYAYFVKRILPLIEQQCPGFIFRLVGSGTENFPAHFSADIQGFVNDIQKEYKTAPFLIVSLLGGTGQLTRIVEAMAHGLPVVATKAAARSSPIRHGVNGLIAADAVEMARHVVALHRDRELARAMGHAARETVRTECSLGHLRDRIAHIFDQT